jgi:hypothetical protein
VVRRLGGVFMALVSQRGTEGMAPVAGREEAGSGGSVPRDAQ